jgi:AcrR family transcriptional regulator
MGFMNDYSGTSDRRVERTRQALRSALIGLILEKHYDTISVQDIIDRANVGRSTFYLHFRDKEDLFRGDWERVLEHFARSVKVGGLDDGRIFPVRELFEHLRDFHHLYRALVRSGKMDHIFVLGQSLLSEKIEPRLRVQIGSDGSSVVPSAVLANYLATEVFSNLKWWLDNNMPETPERMDEIFHQLVAPGFRNVFAGR